MILNKRLTQILSVILVFAFAFNFVLVPAAVAAPGKAKRVPQKKTLVPDIGELPQKNPQEKTELKSKRTKYSTRYVNPDGSFTEEIYLDAKFYQDPQDKKWKKIDNNLKKSFKKVGKLENRANDFNTYLAEESATGEILTIEKDQQNIGLIPVDAKKVKGQYKNSEIIYKNIYDSVDIKYTLIGDKVKEDIIINNYKGQNTFTFELKLEGLDAVQENKEIVLLNSAGKRVFKLDPLFMYDANDKFSGNVAYVLRKENAKTYIDVVADQAFLEDPQTTYPVTIDPTITTTSLALANYVDDYYPDSSFSGMYVWDGITSLVKLNLPALPSDAKISSATFYAYQNDYSSGGGYTTVNLGKITEPWTSSVTWNTQPSSSYLDYYTAQETPAWWDWDVTGTVQEWYYGSHPNYGLKLYYGGTSGGTTLNFDSPKITINYTVDPIGLEDFWGYTQDGVNSANGNLVLQETDTLVPGRGVPVEITRNYNSRKSYVSALFGYGWRSNVEPLIVDTGSGPITYVDGDGTRHIFGEKEGGYVSPGGIYLELAKNTDDTYTLTQKDGTKINFNTTGKLASIVDKNDNTTTYTYDVNGKLTQITDASGRTTTITYGTNGKVENITDSANRITYYEYDLDGNLIKVTDPKGNITSYDYDTDHNITNLTDAQNNTTTIAYDASDRVESISRPITIDGAATTSTTTYTYNSSETTVIDGEGNRVDYTYSPNGNVTEIARNPLDPDNDAVITLDYDNYNNLVQLKDANNNEISGNAYIFTYDLKGNITGVQLPENQTADYSYDNLNNLIRIEDFNNNVSSADYDDKNNQTEATDAKVQTKAKRYNTYGNLKYNTKPISAQDNLILNSSLEKDNNADNWPDFWTQAGTATFNWSDTAKIGNKSISISNPTADAVVKSDLIPYEATEDYAFSVYVKTENTTSPTIAKVEFFDSASTKLGEQIAYALKGTHAWTRLQAIVDQAPANTANMQISLGLQAGSGSVYYDAVQIEKGAMVTAYNLMDNSGFERDEDQDNMPDSWSGSWNLTAEDGLAQNIDPEDDNVYFGNYSFKIKGETTQSKYLKQNIDISGNAGEKLTLSGWSKQIGADSNGGTYGLQVAVNHTDGTTDWRYANSFATTKDDWQHIAVQIEPLQAYSSIDVYLMYYEQTGTAFFDSLRLEYGNSLTVFDYDANGNYLGEVKNQLEKSVYYSYDAAGNKTAQTDANLNNTYYSYDNNDNLTQVTDAKDGVTAYEYDGNNNLTKVTDARNNITTYGYNEFNQVKSITNALTQVMEFGYNKNGNANKIVLPKGDVITGTYDALNRLDSILYNGVTKFNISYDPNGNITSVTDDAQNTTSFQYDKNNRVIEVSEGTENRVNYSYDANSNVTDLTVTEGTASYSNSFNYNALDQMIAQFRDGVNLAEFTYDENSNLTSVSYSNDTFAVYEYDDANQVKSVQNYRNGELLDSYSYSYDNNGNITSVTTDTGTVSYQYDELNQLTQETLLDGTVIDYSYDAAGNRTTKTVTQGGTPITTTYTYDAANQLTAVDGQAYTYDANGNLTDNGEKTYVYNEVNQLVEVKDASGTIATFTYDFSGKRISKTTSSGTVNYHYAGDKVIYETDASGNIIAEYTWDQNDRPVSMIKDGATYYYHVNAHGDVVALTDANSNIVAQYEYDAWGNILSQSGTMASINPYRYAGYMYDEETELYYLMARYYDAEVGRFISRDAFAGFNDDPASLNRYKYTHNNPVMYVDPDGHFLQAAAIGGVVGGISFLAEKFFVDKNPIWNRNEYIKLGTAVLTGAAGGAYGSAITASKAAQVGFSFYSSVKGRIISFAWEEHLTKEQVVESLKREIVFSIGNGVVKTLTKAGGIIIRRISNFFK